MLGVHDVLNNKIIRSKKKKKTKNNPGLEAVKVAQWVKGRAFLCKHEKVQQGWCQVPVNPAQGGTDRGSLDTLAKQAR